MKNIFLIIICTLTLTLNAQNTQLNKTEDLIREYRKFIEDKMAETKLIGVSAGIICNDSVIWKQGFGFADKENNIPMTSATNLCIGSITKSFTALGIMQLHEKQLLDIKNPLVEYLPEFSIQSRGADVRNIDLKSVLIHSSGLPNDFLLNADSKTEKYTDLVKYLKDEYLGYPPMFEFHYSNIGYNLLGHVIYKVSNQDYPDYIKNKILAPTGMINSGFNNYQSLSKISRTYTTEGDYYPSKDKSRNIAAGGMYSNVDDLILFAKELIAIYHGKQGSIIKPETLKDIFSVQNEEIRLEDYKTGFGWFIYENDSNFAAQHKGSTHLSNAGLWILPEQKMAAIFLVNTVGGLSVVNEGAKLLSEIGLKTMDHYREIPNLTNDYKKENSDIPEDSLKKLLGLYSDTRSIVSVTLENNQLLMNTVNHKIVLKPINNKKFAAYKINEDDNTQLLLKQKYSFENVMGYHILFGEDGRRKYAIGHLLDKQTINEVWKNRIGKYKIDGYKLETFESFSEADLYLTKGNILQLKIYYNSGQYTYNMDIESDNELIICGFNESGGQTIIFSDDKEKPRMTIFGLIMKKSD